MSLLLNSAKTITIAGTTMQCVEIYTGEAYTFNLAFTDADGIAINASLPQPWTLTTSAKFYTVDSTAYSTNLDGDIEIKLGNLSLLDPQPQPSAYNISAAWTNINLGLGYIHVGSDITNSGNSTPQVTLANSTTNTVLVVVSLNISKPSTLNLNLTDITREPIGFIVRYQ